MDNKIKNIALHVATPILAAAVCVGIGAAVLIKPVNKLKVYADLAFMGNFDNDGGSALVIRDNDIETDHKGDTYEVGEIIRPKFGELYAVLTSDKLPLDVPVYWGSNAELLDHGACHSSGSVIAGEHGNSVISAHVDTHFAELDKLTEGDIVTLSTNYGKFTYTVRETISFKSTDRKYLTASDEDILTLYTCKHDLLGASDVRIGVICDLTEKSFYTEKKEAE